MRYYFIKELYSRYQQLQSGLQGYSRNSLHDHEGSCLQGYSRKLSRSSSKSYTNQYVFLPSDPDELVDQIKLLNLKN